MKLCNENKTKTTHGKLRRDKDEYLKNYTGHWRLYLIHVLLLFVMCVCLCGNEDNNKKNSHAQDKKSKIFSSNYISCVLAIKQET